ncbi:ThuA domain-containing protein [Massilia endophytica]|uniref:ThuA domain-containing protein n=1 Tax=Massilia endophytica TaxID=2899220 RepID=UPI001E2C032B|nr:ThuA domain-containing protein [Massilia endophytica]UGQ49100.1 ThuA domain-containing protein [Massilia endophytica]
MRMPAAALALSGMLCMQGALAEQFNVLLFTKTAGWHHDSIHAGVTAVQELGKLHDFGVFWTADAERVFNDKELAKYQAVVFLLTTGDVLTEAQQAAFERYIKAGGGYVGVHSASDTEYKWPWYTKMVGRMFHVHPAVQTAVLKVEDRNFPGMERFAPRSLATEEWYEFGPAQSDRLTYLLSVDESTYKPQTKWPDREGKGMGSFHPVSWYQPYDGGRAFYTALGHLPATYGDPVFRHHLYGGIYWATTGRGFKAE